MILDEDGTKPDAGEEDQTEEDQAQHEFQRESKW